MSFLDVEGWLLVNEVVGSLSVHALQSESRFLLSLGITRRIGNIFRTCTACSSQGTHESRAEGASRCHLEAITIASLKALDWCKE